MIDFHSHILPKMDDGSKSREMSVEMLEISKNYGVDAMVATPHFYINREKIENFLERRSSSYMALAERISSENLSVPEIVLGAEVYFFKGISQYQHINELKIGNTDYFLLEMPFEKWSERILNEVEAIPVETGAIPVIAHIDRYIDFQKGTNNINKLLSFDFPVQMNAEYVNSFFTRKKALNLINSGIVKVLGSDCHNTDKRKPDLGKSIRIIENKCGIDTVNNINNYSRQLLKL